MQPARRAGAEPRVGRCASWLPAPSAVRSQLPSLTPVSSQGWGRVFYVRAPALGSARRAGRSARSRVRASAIIGPRRQAWKERGNGAVGRDLWWRYLVGLVWRGVAWPGAPLENLFGTSALTRADGHRSFLCLWSR